MPNLCWPVLAIAVVMSMPRDVLSQVSMAAGTQSTIQTTGSAQLTQQPTRAIMTFAVASSAASARSYPAVVEGEIPLTPQGVTVSASVAAVWRFVPRSEP